MSLEFRSAMRAAPELTPRFGLIRVLYPAFAEKPLGFVVMNAPCSTPAFPTVLDP
jgi:hypothetical protein